MRFVSTAIMLAVACTLATTAQAGNPRQDANRALQLTFKAKEVLWTIPNDNSYRTDRRIIDHHLDILKGKFSYASRPSHPLEDAANRMENIYRYERHHLTKIEHQIKQLMRVTDRNKDKATYDKAKFLLQIVGEIRRIVYDYKKND